MKLSKDIFFGAIFLLGIALALSVFFGFSDWLETKGVPDVVAFYGPIIVGVLTTVIIKHYRSSWLD
jgi:NADH:ubiquinone oxidoreductase subunit 6 (subunit J)